MALESSIVKSIRDRLKKLGIDVEKTHGGLYGTGGKADLYCLIPVHYQVYPVPVYLEVKQPGKESTQLQLAWAAKKRNIGAIVAEVHSLREALEVIMDVQDRVYRVPEEPE